MPTILYTYVEDPVWSSSASGAVLADLALAQLIAATIKLVAIKNIPFNIILKSQIPLRHVQNKDFQLTYTLNKRFNRMVLPSISSQLCYGQQLKSQILIQLLLRSPIFKKPSWSQRGYIWSAFLSHNNLFDDLHFSIFIIVNLFNIVLFIFLIFHLSPSC